MRRPSASRIDGVVITTLLLIVTASAVAAAEPVPGKQVDGVYKVSAEQEVPFLLYLPKNYKSDGKFPLMLFLHGRGESFGPLSLVKKWGPPRMVERGEHLPFIVVSPQCPRKESWRQPRQQAALVKLLGHITKKYAVDQDRVYLTGLSMGGYGSWRLAADHPDRFAAVAPICGGGKVEDAGTLSSVPFWVFHGDKDTAVPFDRSKQMVDAILAAGGKSIRFTTLENIGHNSWSAAYATPELYQWLLQHSLSGRRARKK